MKELFKFFNSLDSIFSKRQKIILSVTIITLGFIITTHRNIVVFRKYYFIFGLGFLAYILALWSLRQGMTRTKALTIFVLPVMYTLAFTSFYFLFQHIRWLTRIPVAIFFGLSYYCLLLSQNVFHVASDRAIPLYRAASTVNFVYTVFTLILIHSIIYSLSLNFYLIGVLIFVLSFPLILQMLWSAKIEGITTQIVVYSAVFSLILAEGGAALSFWSAPPLVLSLYLNSLTYGVLGIILEVLKDRINSRVVYEYGLAAAVLFITIFSLTTYFSL